MGGYSSILIILCQGKDYTVVVILQEVGTHLYSSTGSYHTGGCDPVVFSLGEETKDRIGRTNFAQLPPPCWCRRKVA